MPDPSVAKSSVPTSPSVTMCVIEVGHWGFGCGASWLMDGDPKRPICEHHKRQYETARDDYSHIEWVPLG